MTIVDQSYPYFQSAGIVRLSLMEPSPQKRTPTLEPALTDKPVAKEVFFGDNIYQWARDNIYQRVLETPPAPLVAGGGAVGATLWYRLSYSGLHSAPWQIVPGVLGAVGVAAGFEIYENYTLYQAGKRSLNHAVLDGVSDTLSAGFATYVGSSVGTMIISSAAAGAAAPLVVAGVFAAVLGIGIWYGLSALKEGIFEEMGISLG